MLDEAVVKGRDRRQQSRQVVLKGSDHSRALDCFVSFPYSFTYFGILLTSLSSWVSTRAEVRSARAEAW